MENTLENTIHISTPPHVKTHRTTKKIMLDVIIALIPCAVCGIIYFGLDAFLTEIISVVSAVAAEFIYYFIFKGGFAKKCRNAGAVCRKWWRQFDYTSVVTGLILALCLPASVKWYETMIGAIFAVVIVKMVFGGTGKNIVNPAVTGRVFMFISFSLTTFVAANFGALSASSPALETGATNLGTVLSGGESLSLLDLFLGTGVSGCIGETCKIAILAGYVYLVVRHVIKWWQPLLFIGTTFLFTLFLNGCNAMTALNLTFSGGLMFGAVFMATDYVTSPKGIYGQIIYYVFLGLLTAVLRHVTGVEVVSFVIMLGNIITPLLDRYVIRRHFGYRRVKKIREQKEKAGKALKAENAEKGTKEEKA